MDNPLDFDTLSAKIRDVFNINQSSLTWIDEENDSITIGNTDDLIEAALSCTGTLKIHASEIAAPAAPSSPVSDSDGWEEVEQPKGSAAHVEAQSPIEPSIKEQPRARPQTPTDASFEEKVKVDTQPSKEHAIGMDNDHSEIPVRFPAVHSRVACDITGMYPIIGVRWHKKGADYDLCAEAFHALPAEQKPAFEKITHEGATPVPYEVDIDDDVKVCGKDDSKSTTAAAEELAVHNGVMCDLSGMRPIVGNRWHLIGQNYDLCEAEFQKLSAESKRRFELIAKPQDRPRPFGYPLRFDNPGDASEQAAQLLRTVLTALRHDYSVEIDLVPRGAESQHQRGGVRTEIPIDVTFNGGDVRMEPNVDEFIAAAAAGAFPGRLHNQHCFDGGHPGHHHNYGVHNQKRRNRKNQNRKVIPAGDGLPTEEMKCGSCGEGVQQLQSILCQLGFLPVQSLKRRGFFGPRTVAAVRSFQAHKRIGDRTKWGVVNAATRSALLDAVAELQSVRSPVPSATDPVSESIFASAAEPVAEPSVEPVVKPSAEPAVEPSAEPAVEPSAEPAVEPSAEPAVEPSADASGAVESAPKAWANELAQLATMGFVNEELLIPILERTNGAVDAVIAALLD